ncbi:MAG: type II toxin-antitoxin system prevent-host-death family antitoxin [Candidatus Eremiobacteraeota bacterium]|nr:type II toxin-antitoxin system prevent-host-death family antitoxin [Candidatus Eremiobacteraeota bacterium]
MEKHIGIFEGKTHFSALIEQAQRGNATIVTKNGTPVARIVPFEKSAYRELGIDDGLGYIAEDFDAPLPADLLNQFLK